MKIGTIIKNHWAGGENNPARYFIYTGIKGRYVTGICLEGNRLGKIEFYKSDVKKNPETFETVGYCKAFDIMKEDLKEEHAKGVTDNND